ncbi:hypothetical protein KIKIMORA_01010 [Brevundimonas phage vB_BpoS-Kikimora]|uniref:Uncharacterized protein n=1 Tax=Brevundimonas phage vB_BpoS-Kikimora TaxID=2948601 RepID=A0A9E7MT10_9CAUD|nr:hypothetical protein KIKIMORA_01010 [Brevundimonas phage vB_BpoS-Kikimora]
MRRAWIERAPSGWAYPPYRFRLVSESTLFPGKAQPHVSWFSTPETCRKLAERGGLALQGGPIPLPLVTQQDRDQFRADAQRNAEAALNQDAGLEASVYI